MNNGIIYALIPFTFCIAFILGFGLGARYIFLANKKLEAKDDKTNNS